MGSWLEAGHQKDKAVIGSLEFSSLRPALQRVEGAGNGVNGGPRLREEASATPQEYGVL